MLNLVPTSEKAAGMMKKLGINFVDANGEIMLPTSNRWWSRARTGEERCVNDTRFS